MTVTLDYSRDSTLIALARRINQREDGIQKLVSQTRDAAFLALTEAKLQGQDLIEALAHVKHPDQQDWLKAHCPKTAAMATRYMGVAKNWHRLEECTGMMRQLMLLMDIPTDVKEEPERAQWPPAQEAISRLGRFISYIERNPADAWPKPVFMEARRELEPVMKVFFPEKWNGQ